MNIIIWDYESIWPDAWPQNKCRVLWPIFHGPVNLCLSWRLFDVCTWSFRIMTQYDLTFDLKVNVGYCDLYFMVQWLCLIPWWLFRVWTSLFGIMNQYDPTHDLKINVGHLPIFRVPVILCYILKTIWCMNIILGDYGSVWPDIWPQNKCMSLTYISWSTDFALYLKDFFWCMSVIFSDNEKVWPKPLYLKINIGQHDLYFMVKWICLISSRLFDGWTS